MEPFDIHRPALELLDAAVRAGLPPHDDLQRWSEDEGVVLAILHAAGWRFGTPLLEVGCGLFRGGHIALQTGPATAYLGLESHEALARLAQILAPDVHRARIVHAPDLPAAIAALEWPSPITILSWDLWPTLHPASLHRLAGVVRPLLEVGGRWILRAPADDPRGPFTDLHPWYGTVDRRRMGQYGTVPRTMAQHGMGSRRRSLHSDPSSVVWTISPRIPVERRHALPS